MSAAGFFCHTCSSSCQVETSAQGDLTCLTCRSEFVEISPAGVSSLSTPRSASIAAAVVPQRQFKSKFDCPCASPLCPAVAGIFADSGSDREVLKRGIDLFVKISSNILEKEGEPKYRRIVIAKVRGILDAVRGVEVLLRLVGFVNQTNADGALCLELPMGANLSLLKDGRERVLKFLAKADAEYLAGLERNKAIWAENQKEIDAESSGSKARRAKILEDVEYSKQVNAHKPVVASVATPTVFGATLKTVPAPQPQQRG